LPRLFLEWFSQNGRTVIELVDPIIEFIQEEQPSAEMEALAMELDDELDDDLDEDDLDDDDFDDDDLNDEDLDGDDSDADSLSTSDDGRGGAWGDSAFGEGENDDDPFGLFPKGLEAELDKSAHASSWTPEPDDETLQQWEEWDEIVDGTKDVPLSSLFDPPLKLPPADSLDDQQVVCQLNLILSRLALHNIAFHMCEHFTPRNAYKLLLETILPEESTHPELPRIGFTMNFDTAESCDECAAEFERRDAERKAKRQHDSQSEPTDEDDDLDDDAPF
jgi:hypothetical protein